MPLLPQEVNVFVLKHRYAKQQLCAFTERRHVVEAAAADLATLVSLM